MVLKSYWESLWAILFPPLCVGCGDVLQQHEPLLCLSCQYHLPINDFHLFPQNLVVSRMENFMIIDRGLSYLTFTQASIVQSIIHHIKYKHRTDVATYFGKILGVQVAASQPSAPFDYVVPIPLHPKKLRQRGYNQSEYLAKAIAEILGIPLNTDNLIRVKNTESQTGLSDFKRLANVEKAFFCRDKPLFVGKHILLVDDVLTTGATLYAAALAIRDIEGVRLSVATLALA